MIQQMKHEEMKALLDIINAGGIAEVKLENGKLLIVKIRRKVVFREDASTKNDKQ